MNSICIVRLSALGDVVMFVPTVRTIQHHFPQAKITWVISSLAHQLVEGLEGVEFIVIDKPKRIKDYFNFWRMMKGRRFDVLLCAQASLRANYLYPLISAKRKIGYSKKRGKDFHHWFIKESIAYKKHHTVDEFLEFAKTLGASPAIIKWAMPLDKAHHDWARQHIPTGQVITINPAASKKERTWPLERYIALINQIHSRWDVSVVLTGGPVDWEIDFANTIASKTSVINLVGKTKPKQLMAVIQNATLMICPDTGPGHMASALSTPVIGLFAVTRPQISGPYLSLESVVDCYPQALASISGKSLDTCYWGERVHSEKAMELIEVDAVMKKLESML
jgi:heptosyltransferase I